MAGKNEIIKALNGSKVRIENSITLVIKLFDVTRRSYLALPEHCSTIDNLKYTRGI